jgi:DNA-binding SARP family transcriptional activator
VLRVRLLGEMVLEADGRRLQPPRRRGGRSLLAYLALHPGLHARGDLAARLWPAAAPGRARASLRTALASVRSGLGPAAGAALTVERDRIGLAADIEVDALEFRRLVADGRLEEALDLASGELLQGLDDEWVLDARDEHLRELVAVLTTLAAREEATGNLAGAVEHTRSAVALDALSESASRELMRRLTAAGDRAAALAAYERLRERLGQQLGVSPAPATSEMAEAIRAARPRGDGAGAGAAPISMPAIPSAELLTRDAIRLARRSGDAEALSNALDTAHMMLAGTGDAERLAVAEEMIAVGDESGRADLVARGRIRRAVELLERGEFRRVAEEGMALDRIAAEAGRPEYGWWPGLWRATTTIHRGESEAALGLARKAFEVGRAVYGEAAELELAAQVFWIRWQDCEFDELRDATAGQAERFADVTPAWRCAQAAVAAHTGDDEMATALIDEFAGPRLPVLRADSAWAVGASLLAEACAITRHSAAAATLFDALEPIADRWACGASGSLCLCPISRSLGLLAAALDRWEEAERLFDDAAGRAAAAGARKLVARIESERAGVAAPAR